LAVAFLPAIGISISFWPAAAGRGVPRLAGRTTRAGIRTEEAIAEGCSRQLLGT
jgi:hypothetical protein